MDNGMRKKEFNVMRQRERQNMYLSKPLCNFEHDITKCPRYKLPFQW